MRTLKEVNKIVLHCSATKDHQDFDAADIRRWHTSPPNNWSDIGYHFVIKLDGTVEKGRALCFQGAHVRGHNKDSIGICYVGGLGITDGPASQGGVKWIPMDTMTPEQELSFEELVCNLRGVYGEDVSVHGHNEYARRACPSFNVLNKYGNDFCRQ